MFGRRRKTEALHARMAALDALRANVMLADGDLNIVYTNPAASALLREAAGDVRQALSALDAASLHRSQSATITAGGREFDLLITPLVENGRQEGFVLEWTDAQHRLQQHEHDSQAAAISRTMAVVQFDPNGTVLHANANFLTTMGYTLDEIRGRHHSMFVEPGRREHPDYKAFWERLRRGELQKAQFRRIGKNGREVWIDGAYDPVMDDQGRVTKVVKFAIDITPQVNLLADLKRLIDSNFGEISGAIDLSTTEAHSAAEAAGQTAESVRTVTASAEQLAASFSEIARSMAACRDATENAFGQAVAVGRSTDTLAIAAQSMNGIVGLIRNVASQINLLALNATIEAARAGEAGKGFAVVASQVKTLAVQAAKATEQISAEIDGIQNSSTEVAGALGAIRDAVTLVRGNIAITAAAVEEQRAVTRDMSSIMQSASGAVSTITGNITEIASAITQAAQAVSKTKEAAHVLVR